MNRTCILSFIPAALLTTVVVLGQENKVRNEEYPDFYTGQHGAKAEASNFVDVIRVSEPGYRSDVHGDVLVKFKAPGMELAQAMCWQQPGATSEGPWGHDAVVAPEFKLDAQGNGGFTFHADEFPNGPVTIRIHTRNKQKQDMCELQLFNRGGVVWNQGIPKSDPPGAKGMKLLFADDFDGPLSIADGGKNARYSPHKTGGGDFSGWPFTSPRGENKPFGQVGTFLRIRASKDPGTKGMSGILSSLRDDGTGVQTPIPAYFECRFVAQSAPGTWPAFWTLTKGPVGLDPKSPEYAAVKEQGTDELDVIEGYGGYGKKNPNGGGVYHSVTHFWGQDKIKPDWYDKEIDGKPNPKYLPHNWRTDTLAIGGKSSWSWTFHTYGLAITETDTIYYFDDIEIGRHPTGPLSKKQPHWFLINYAIGGISGWQIDLARYDEGSDMYVDFVRVYHGGKGRAD
jgi:hypothetical protein